MEIEQRTKRYHVTIAGPKNRTEALVTSLTMEKNYNNVQIIKYLEYK